MSEVNYRLATESSLQEVKQAIINANVDRPMTHEDAIEINNSLVGIQNVIEGKRVKTIYGFHIDSGESDPTAAVTYLADAIGMTPAYMDYTNNKWVWGSWEDAFFMPRPCMLRSNGTVDYYLNPLDYSKKYNSNEDSDIANISYEGNAMMEWGKNGKRIWYKIVPDSEDSTSASIYIADYQADKNYHCYSFYNRLGNLVDHFYTPIYNGTLDANGALRSMSGVAGTSLCKSKTAAQEIAAADKNNPTGYDVWDTEVFADIIIINLLLTLITKTLNSQAAVGQGLIDSGTETINDGFTTGIHNTKGLFYGTNSGASATYTNAVKVFGMENWWGYQWRRFRGLVNVNGTEKYKLTRRQNDGSTINDYVTSTTAADYTGYLTGAALPEVSSAYINKITFDGSAYTPTTASGSASTYYCDVLWTNNNQVDYALRGGDSYNGARCGSWCLSLDYDAGRAAWSIGASPSCKPLV